MNEDRSKETALRTELKKLSESYLQGGSLPPAEFMARYKKLLDALYAAEHPELTGEGNG